MASSFTPSSASWVGAAPISQGGFSFANGDFFAEASGRNQHRRATPQELAAHFNSGSERDHPAHWFEAQLTHYGLKPSKSKSVARMRLFDAIQAGTLAVPPSIATVEGQLKKEWTKQDRAAKKTAPGQGLVLAPAPAPGPGRAPNPQPAAARQTAAAAPAPAPAASSKRKPESQNVGRQRAPPKTRGLQTARRSSAWLNGPGRQMMAATTRRSPSPPPPAPAPGPAPAAAPKFRTKQTARRSRGSSFAARGRIYQTGSPILTPSPPPPSPPTPVAAPPWPPQYARCSRGSSSSSSSSAARGRIYQTNSSYDSGCPSPTFSSTIKSEFHDNNHSPQSRSLPAIGYINGFYEIDSPYVDQQWPSYNSDFQLTLRLAGTSIWGSFDLGLISGIMYFPQRPTGSSRTVDFIWRGEEDQGPIVYGNNNRGCMTFLGNGEIEGDFDYMSIGFRGRRDPDCDLMSGVSTWSLQDKWDGYSEQRYEEENRARWG